MIAPSRWRTVATEHPRAVDVGIAVAIYAVVLFVAAASDPTGHGGPIGGFGIASATVACSALLLRRRWPRSVLAVATLCAFCVTTLTEVKSPIALAAGVGMFTVVTQVDRPTAARTFGLVTGSLVVGDLLSPGGPWVGTLSLIALIALAWAVGETVRANRAYVAAVEERALRAEQSREAEARRRVAEERLRIARELHDVVAHHIALINVQAGVAAHRLRDRPDQAEEALAHIRVAGRSVLAEMQVMLGVLRAPERDLAPAEPAPSIERLDALIESFRSAGLNVEITQRGTPRALPAPVDLAAYRVIQEALTNIQKHGGGAGGRVVLTSGPAGLEVVIDNVLTGRVPDVESTPAPAGAGHGILGMRERAVMVGGTLQAEDVPGGGFRVHAVLPVPEGTDDDDPGRARGRSSADPRGLPCARGIRIGPDRGGRGIQRA